jgi:hypothetical protein
LNGFGEITVTTIHRLTIGGFGFLKFLRGSEMLHLSEPT